MSITVRVLSILLAVGLPFGLNEAVYFMTHPYVHKHRIASITDFKRLLCVCNKYAFLIN